MAQWLAALVAVAENLGSAFCTSMVIHKHLYLYFQGNKTFSDALRRHQACTWYGDIHEDKTVIHTKFIHLKIFFEKAVYRINTPFLSSALVSVVLIGAILLSFMNIRTAPLSLLRT